MCALKKSGKQKIRQTKQRNQPRRSCKLSKIFAVEIEPASYIRDCCQESPAIAEVFTQQKGRNQSNQRQSSDAKNVTKDTKNREMVDLASLGIRAVFHNYFPLLAIGLPNQSTAPAVAPPNPVNPYPRGVSPVGLVVMICQNLVAQSLSMVGVLRKINALLHQQWGRLLHRAIC